MSIQLVRMVNNIDSKFRLSPRVKEAMLQVPREIFVPNDINHNAYNLDALPIGLDQFISSPFTVAKMTQYLDSDGCDSVLEIGCGSGYQAAILSKLFRRVFSIERIDRLRREAAQKLRMLGIMNVSIRFNDGQNGWDMYAPFDRILFSAATANIPDKLVNQLAEGGILVAPMIESGDKQVIKRFIKRHARLHLLDTKGECFFVLVKNDVENC